MLQSYSTKGLISFALACCLVLCLATYDGIAGTQFPATEFYQGAQLSLAQAIENGDLEAVQRLAPQTDLKTLGNKGMTILHFALLHTKEDYSKKHLDIITALMRAEADYNQAPPPPPESNTPLRFALFMSAKYPLVLKAMLDGGLPPETPMYPGREQPIIFELTSDETLEALKTLVEYGADVNRQTSTGDTPLLTAYDSSRQYKVISFLLESGAKPDIPQQFGYTLSYAVEKDLEKSDAGYPYLKELKALRDNIIQKGYQWPPFTPEQERDRMRARGETPRVPKGQLK